MHRHRHGRRTLPFRLSTLASVVGASRPTTFSGMVETGMTLLGDGEALVQTKAVAFVEPAATTEDLRRAAARSRAESFPQTMINFGDAQYVSYLKIGNQILAGMLDTGSFELVVFGADCRTCGVAAHYNPSLSSTFRFGRLISQQSYGSGSCHSQASSDILQIGPFREAMQNFWTVQQANMSVLAHSAFEVIIGLGPPEAPAAGAWKSVTAVISNVTSYYDMAEPAPDWALRQVDKRLEIADETGARTALLGNFGVTTFSVCLGAAARSNGIFVWNDLSALSQPSLFARVPVTGYHTWSTSLTNPILVVSRGSTSSSSDEPVQLGCGADAGCSAILDTGMSLIAAPRIVIEKLREAMLLLKPDCSNPDDLPNLVFELEGHTFSLPPEAYIAEVEGNMPEYLAGLVEFGNWSVSHTCQLLLVESVAITENGPLWILGMPFFRKYYTTFHVGESREERAFYIAEAGEDCYPVGLGEQPLADRRSLLRRVELQKVHLPQTARVAMREQFANL